MIRFVLAAVWICAVSIGTVLFAFQHARTGKDAEPAAAFFGDLSNIRTDVISVPIVGNGQVEGYFLARLSYSVDAEKLKALSIPVNSLLIDEIYSYLYANPTIDFALGRGFDVAAFRDGLRERINRRLGSDFVHEVLIEQAEYLTKTEIRNANVKRRLSAMDDAPAAPAGGGR